jgi:glycine hydroxymethyltransferase
VTGGSDNHLILIDLTNKGVPGKKAARALDRAGIELNYNSVPFDPRKPFDPSGIRIGTPAVTSRGLREPEMKMIAEWMGRVVAAPEDEALGAKVAGEVRELVRGFPAPGISVMD